ncbi:MAG: flagellar motor switch phosphatase FliY [bacterium]
MAEDDDMLSDDEIDALLDEEGDEGEDGGTGGSGELTLERVEEVYDEVADSVENILSTILNMDVDHRLVQCEKGTVESIRDTVEDRRWVVVRSGLGGALSGTATYLLPEDDALKLADVMMGQEGDEPPEEFDEVYESAIVEMYNQVVNSLANTMNEITGENVELEPPESEGMEAEEFLDSIQEDEFLWIEYSLEVEDLIEGGVLYELQPVSTGEILSSSGDNQQPEPEPSGSTSESTSDTTSDTGSESSGMEQGQKEVKSVDFQQFEAAEGEEPVGNLNMLMDVPMEVSVELGRTDLQVKEILDLGQGSIIELERLAGEPVDLLVNGRLVARGEVVVIDENFGVRVTSIVSPMDRLGGE